LYLFHDLTVLKVILLKWSTSIISNSSPNATPIFFAITSQMVSFVQNSNVDSTREFVQL
ncbi:hypothetical protein RhiirA5_352688, partial [Rhizophagus irregularis]